MARCLVAAKAWNRDNTVGQHKPTVPKESSLNVPDEALWEECMEDLTLPPGGPVRRIVEKSGLVPAGRMSLPDYLTRQGRDLRIDLLRGYFVLAMIIDHVRGASPLYLVTGGNRFFTSAAEGFILTSGFVTGMVYRRLIEEDRLGAALLKLLVRAFSLFLLTVSLTLVFLSVSEILGLPWAQGIDLSNPQQLIIGILTLHRTYYLVDVMLLYTVLFAIAPLAFIILSTGRVWPVLAASWLLWGLSQVSPGLTTMPWPILGNYLFELSAWQVLFFSGLVVGYRRDRLPALGGWATRLALLATGLGTVLLIAAYFIIDPPTDLMLPPFAIGSPIYHEVRLWLQYYVFSRVDLRLGRILASAVTFSFLFLFVTHAWSTVKRIVGWLLLPLGQHALYAYTAHIAIVAVIAVVITPLTSAATGPQWLNALVQIGAVLAIWLFVRVRLLAPTPSTRLAWYASPILIVLAALIVIPLDPSPRLPGLGTPAAQAAVSQERVPRRFGVPIRENAQALSVRSAAAITPTVVPGPRSGDTQDSKQRMAKYATNLKGDLEEHIFYSPELDRDMPYVIYLPPDYLTGGRRYPVLYMLHGRGGSRDEWLSFGLVDIADHEILEGRLPPMIIVVPQGDNGYWANHSDNGPRWGEFISRDLVSYIDQTYHTLRSPASRAIGGLSMGGWGALHHAFSHPEIFGVVGAHSPSLRPDDGSLDFLGRGTEFARKDPMQLARIRDGLQRLHIWVDTAQGDPWRDRAEELHRILSARGIDHTWQVYPGVHDWYYWHEHTVDYLRFYGNSLARQ